jgi:hypothetical protein
MMDQIDHSKQIVISWPAEYMNKIEELLMRSICIIVSNEAAVRSKAGCKHRHGPAQMPRLPREVGDPGEHPNTTHRRLRCERISWCKEMGVWQKKSKRAVNRSNLKMPKFTGLPKSITIF